MNGHVRKRNGRWQARKPDPSPSGGRPGRSNPEISRTFDTKAEALDWLAEQHTAVRSGAWVDPRKAEQPFRGITELWQESWPNRVSPGTQGLYRQILATHVLPDFADLPLNRIDHAAVQRWVNQLSASGSAAGTVRNAYAVLRNCLNTAVRYNLLAANPCTNIDLPRANREEMLFLTPGEITRLANAIDPWYRVMVYVAAYTGLRAGELLALRRSDVDLLRKSEDGQTRGVIHVRRALKDINGVLSFGEVKTAGSRRTVTLPASVRELLEAHLSAPLPGGNGPDALVFPSKTGKPIRHRLFSRRHFRRAVAGYTDKDGTKHPGALPDKAGLRWHDLRHTAASLAIHSGAHPLLVSKMLGHSNVEITLNRYSHLFPDVAEQLADRMDALFVSAAEPQAEVEGNVVALPQTESR